MKLILITVAVLLCATIQAQKTLTIPSVIISVDSVWEAYPRDTCYALSWGDLKGKIGKPDLQLLISWLTNSFDYIGLYKGQMSYRRKWDKKIFPIRSIPELYRLDIWTSCGETF